LFQRAEKAWQAGNHTEAATLYRPLLHAGFQPGLILHRLATIANAQGDFAGAWELHLQAIAVDPALAAKLTAPDSPHHGVLCRQEYDLENVPACPVCGSTEQAPMMVVNCLAFNHYHPSIHPIRRWVKCAACGHGFANPRPTAAALHQAFQDPPPPHLLPWTYDRLTLWSDIVHDLWSRHRHQLGHGLQTMPQLGGGDGAQFLDVGTANGALAGVALDFGYRVYAIDIHPGYAEHVRRLGVEFVLGDVSTYDFGSRRFDIIALGDIIEHLADPRGALAKVASLLKPDGLIWLSTPNHEGVWTRALRDRDAMWLEGEHLQYFSLRSLARLCHDQGLRLVDYRLSKRFIGCAEVIAQRAARERMP
jgi:2-polyprenyl-3-methyl-5-hydroxy-6-metoxy-1,4-benzoquinol methylase